MKVDVTSEAVVVEAPPLNQKAKRLSLHRLLRARLPLMAAVFVLLAAPLAVLVWHSTPALYTASADIRLLTSRPHIIGSGFSGDSSAAYEKFLNTQVALITGTKVLSQILDDPQIKNTSIGSVPDPLLFLKHIISVQAQPNSELITISCALPSRDDARLLVDKTLNAYMAYALNQEADTGGERLRVLVAERDSRQADLDNQLRKIVELQQAVGMPAPGQTVPGADLNYTLQSSLAKATEDLTHAESAISLLEQKASLIKELNQQFALTPSQPVFAFSVEEKLASDTRIAAIRTEFTKADTAFALAADKYAKGSPQFEAEREKMNSLKSKLNQTEQTVRGEILASVAAANEREFAAANADADNARSRKKAFEKTLEEKQIEANQKAKDFAQLEELKVRADETRAVLRALRDEITSIAVDSSTPAHLKAVGETTVPVFPDATKRMQLLLLALAGAATAGLAAGVAREITNQTVQEPEDLTDLTDKPVISVVPDVPQVPQQTQPYLLAECGRDEVRCAIHEIRKIMPRLLGSGASTETKVCAVVSPSAGEGRTFIACNLSIVLAQANRRVLLIDASPEPTLERVFGLEPGPGIADMICQSKSLSDCIRHTHIPNVFFLGAGMLASDLSAKVASREMAAVIHQAEKCFDHVVIDTPPFLAMADAGILAQLAHAVLLVARANQTNPEHLRQTANEIRHAKDNLLGIVFNGYFIRRELDIALNLLRSYFPQKAVAPESVLASCSGAGNVNDTSKR